jgi:hypothetical protein
VGIYYISLQQVSNYATLNADNDTLLMDMALAE